MRQVIKGDGSSVPYDREKLVRSMQAAGASLETSEAVARMVEGLGESISTQEMRTLVMRELLGCDQEAASSYDATRRLVARRAVEVMPGVARLPVGILRSMGLGQGEAFLLRSDGRTRTVRVELNERTAIGKNEVRLNTRDLEGLAVEDGERILIVRRSPGGGDQDAPRAGKLTRTTLRGGRSQDGGRPPSRGARRPRREA